MRVKWRVKESGIYAVVILPEMAVTDNIYFLSFSASSSVSFCFFLSTDIALVITAGIGTPISPAFSVIEITSFTINAMHTPSRS